MRNGRIPPSERLGIIESWFKDGGVLVQDGAHFFPSGHRLKEVRRVLTELGLHRSDDQIKTTYSMAADLKCCEALVTRAITEDLRSAAKVGNVHQTHPGVSAIYIRVDERTAQPIFDGDLRRKEWYSHNIDGIAERVPDRDEDTQVTLTAYAAQAWRQMAVVQGLPSELVKLEPPALPGAKGDEGD